MGFHRGARVAAATAGEMLDRDGLGELILDQLDTALRSSAEPNGNGNGSGDGERHTHLEPLAPPKLIVDYVCESCGKRGAGVIEAYSIFASKVSQGDRLPGVRREDAATGPLMPNPSPTLYPQSSGLYPGGPDPAFTRTRGLAKPGVSRRSRAELPRGGRHARVLARRTFAFFPSRETEAD
jgi:hypothetical protein